MLYYAMLYQDADQNVDEMLNAGTSILGSLRSQGSILRGTRKKILDLTNTLGLSNTLIRFIERRLTQDRYIFYGGMIFVVVVLYLLLSWY